MSEDQAVDREVVEKEARLYGWVPKEEFRDGDHWVDAPEFVKRGKEINPILRKNNEVLMRKLEAAEHEVAEVKRVAKEFKKYQEEQAAQKVKELQTQLESLKAQKKEAITQNDGEAVVDLEEQIEAVKEQQKEVKKAPEPEVQVAPATLDPIVSDWMIDNTWFGTDQEMTRAADLLGQRVHDAHPELRGKAFFDELDKQLKDRFSDYFEKPGRRSPVTTTPPSVRKVVSSNKHTYENLPQDAKEACDRMIAQGVKITREQYCDYYDWD